MNCSNFEDVSHMNTYANLPMAQRATQQMVDRFNAAESYGAGWNPSAAAGARVIQKYRRSFMRDSLHAA